MASLVKRTFQTDDDELEIIRRMRTDIIGNLGHIRIIKRGINLVQDEKRRWLVAGEGTVDRQICDKYTCQQLLTCG